MYFSCKPWMATVKWFVSQQKIQTCTTDKWIEKNFKDSNIYNSQILQTKYKCT